MSEDFGAITILAPKCQKCPKVNTCDHKQMSHLGFIVPVKDLEINLVVARGDAKSSRQLKELKRRFNYENH